MEKVETHTRPIISFLKELKGDNLFISGDCLLSTAFNIFINEYTGLRPAFLLQPNGTKEKLILITDEDVKIIGNKRYVSTMGLSVNFGNVCPLMYILRKSEFDENLLEKILAGYDLKEGIYAQDVYNEELARLVSDKGFIQPSAMIVNFTATFQHEDSRAGTFTLDIMKG